ncbi:MAG: CBS domain-containing protein [Lentisphaerae bacterium]|nr:CBS domain-containing protein [Lentisphaerota bacterium]
MLVPSPLIPMPVLPLTSEQSPLVLLDLLFKLKVRDVMTTDLVTARRADTLRYVQALMKTHRITGVPVVENGRLFGIVSMDDIMTALDRGHIDDPVERHMTTTVVVLEEDMPLSFGASYFDKYRFGRFPVLNKDNSVVGILTSRDISASLLLELYKEYHKLEAQVQPPAPVGAPRTSLQVRVKQNDLENAGKGAHEIKRALAARRVDPAHIRRASIAAYEMEINLVLHSSGGTLRTTIDNESVEIVARDRGPGIADVQLALQDGFSTANDWIRSLGFGAGMGLGNIRRVADEFSLDSKAGGGTTVRAVIRLPPPVPEEAPHAGG